MEELENPKQQSDDDDDYDPFKRPPDLTISRKHAFASRFANPKILENENDKADLCPCCGRPVVKFSSENQFSLQEIEELGLCCPRSDFNFNGAGIALYFEFLIFSCLLLILILLPSGAYNVTLNASGNRCELENLQNNDKVKICAENYFNKYSLSNRYEGIDVGSSVLNLFASLFVIAATIYYRRQMNKTVAEIDNANVAISDYSIQVNNLPKTATKEDIQEFFSKKLSETIEQQEFRKVCMGYNIQPYKELQALQNTKEQLLVLSNSCQKVFQTFQVRKSVCFLCELIKFFRAKIIQRSNNLYYQSNAPDPGDVLWENLGVSEITLIIYKIITNTASILLLGICFGIILGISIGQQVIIENSKNDKSSGTAFAITLLGIAASLSISIINNVLAIAIRKFASVERPSTLTEYNISIAKKLGLAQFLNTAIITLITNFALSSGTNPRKQLWIDGGLNSDVSLILITNGIVPVVMSIIDPMYFFRLFQRWKINNAKDLSYLTQKQANTIFEEPAMDLAKKYAQVTKTILVTCFYAYLLPIGIPIAIGSIFFMYWIEKYLLIKRDAKPPPIGDDLAEEMVDFYIELSILIYAIGCCTWEGIIYDTVHPATWVQFSIALLNYIFPIENLFGKLLDVVEVSTKQSYDEMKLNIWDDYDRRNPVTMEEALENWMDEADKDETQNKGQLVQKFMVSQKQNATSKEDKEKIKQKQLKIGKDKQIYLKGKNKKDKDKDKENDKEKNKNKNNQKDIAIEFQIKNSNQVLPLQEDNQNNMFDEINNLLAEQNIIDDQKNQKHDKKEKKEKKERKNSEEERLNSQKSQDKEKKKKQDSDDDDDDNKKKKKDKKSKKNRDFDD